MSVPQGLPSALRSRKGVGLLVLIALWIAIVTAVILSRMPNNDEGMYTFAPHSYLTRGTWAAPEIEPSGFVYVNIDKPLTRIDRIAYWQLPLLSRLHAAWFYLVGWGFQQQRFFCALCGMLALAVLFDLLRRISGNISIAAIATLLTAFDWGYITASSVGRMEMTGALFGLLALYAYERFGFERPLLSRLLSGFALGAAAMIHPIVITTWGCVYVVRSLLDWRRIRPAQIAVFLVPVLVTSALFGLWISEDFEAFREQMSAQAGFRTSLYLNEWPRYSAMFGLSKDLLPGSLLRSLLAWTFLAAIVFLIARWPRMRNMQGLRLLAVLTGFALLALAVFDTTKWPAFGLHIVPWLCALAAYALHSWRESHPRLVALWLGLYVLAPILAAGYVVRRDTLHTVFNPTVAALHTAAGPSAPLVFTPPEFRFAYSRPLVFDLRLGFISRKTAPAIVIDKESTNGALGWAEQGNPALFAHIQGLLKGTCSIGYENEKYAVYSCPPNGASGSRPLPPK